MQVQKFTFNPLQENTFVVFDENKMGVIIDPGNYFREENDLLKSFIEDEGITLKAILNTHAHLDHIAGVTNVKTTFNAPFYLHEKDLPTLKMADRSAEMYGLDQFVSAPHPDIFLKENETLSFGSLTFEVLFAPGHAPGHVVFYNKEHSILFNGDVLFAGSFGRVDLPGGDMETLKKSITETLFSLPDNTVVCCGHGPETEIGVEKKHNAIFNY